MPVQFAVLASGSRGNAALVRSRGYGLLIDVGLGPRTLGRRLAEIGMSLDDIGAVLLTHTHGDHVRDATLKNLARRGIPLLCHESHRLRLCGREGLLALENRRLVRTYDERPFFAPGGARVEAIPLSHDSGPTFGFRVECPDRPRGRPVSVGLVADTGTWWDQTADALADADILALEFNHDVELERTSPRSPSLIARNLSARGHLSNVQGADLLAAVLQRSRLGSVRHVVLMHLSQECNRQEIAIREAQGAVRRCRRRVSIHAAHQDRVTPNLALGPARRVRQPEAVAAFPWEAA